MTTRATISSVLTLSLWLSLCFVLTQAIPGSDLLIRSSLDPDASPTVARNIRAAARYHLSLANKATNLKLKAENDDDVDAYEEQLDIMRREDEKWQAEAAKYDQLRDILEAKIRTGELIIKGFNNKYEKGSVASIVDLVTFRAKH